MSSFLQVGNLLYLSIAECNCFGKGRICIKCDENGKCKCKPKYTGDKCEKCIDGRHKPKEGCPGNF